MEIAKCAIFALSSYCWPITASRGFCDKRISSKNVLLLVFSVTPFKIDQNKNKNRSIAGHCFQNNINLPMTIKLL